jgi:uncharacterized membrane protein (DUF485 family)
MSQYELLNEERKTRSNLKKKQVFITVTVLRMFGTSIALPVIISFTLPISV